MNKQLKSLIQVLFSLALGFFLIWFIYKDLTEEDKQNVVQSFQNANYWWILLSVSIAVLSHLFRAYRWKYPLESMKIHIDLPNRFAAVMVGYLANLAFPRLGEVTRCAILSRYQKQPFEKLFGTVVAERMVDAVILLGIVFFTVIIQLGVLRSFLNEALGPMFEKIENLLVLGIVGLIGLVVAYFGWKFLQKSIHPLAAAFRGKLSGLLDGIKSLKRMDGQLGFYFYTILIWASYIMMYVVTFQAFPETSAVPFGGMLASFTMGGLTIAVVQGGLGAYPLGVMAILMLYGVNKDLGYAFGWIVWSGQTIMIIVVGFLSMIAMPLINTKVKPEVEPS